MSNLDRLLAMMEYTRKDGSEGESQFIERFIMPYKPEVYVDPGTKQPVAYVVTVNPEAKSTLLFSAHTDTVHSKDAPVKQVINYDEESGLVYKTDGMPLGADNAAGVWMLLEMIDAGCAGTYIFHHGEECGGIGSACMATHYAEFIKQFTHAIAFDRRGMDSVITEQMCGDTSSLTFAQTMSELLNHGTGFAYQPDDTGTFTDTANYADLIPECTNISVGYYDEHSGKETLDTWHVQALRDRVVAIFSADVKLPVVRDHTVVRPSRWDIGFTSYLADPQDADDFLAMHFKDVVGYVRLTPPDEVAEKLLSLADEVAYWKDAALEKGVDMEVEEEEGFFPMNPEVYRE